MDVVFRLIGQVVIDDEWQAGNVDAARGHIGGDQHLHRAGFEVSERCLPLGLGAVTVQGGGWNVLTVQTGQQFLTPLAGAHENQGLLPVPVAAHEQEELAFLAFIHRHHPLPYRCRAGLAGGGIDAQRFAQAAAGQFVDAGCKSGRKKKGLPGAW